MNTYSSVQIVAIALLHDASDELAAITPIFNFITDNDPIKAEDLIVVDAHNIASNRFRKACEEYVKAFGEEK